MGCLALPGAVGTEPGGSTASLGALGPAACSRKVHSYREKMFLMFEFFLWSLSLPLVLRSFSLLRSVNGPLQVFFLANDFESVLHDWHLLQWNFTHFLQLELCVTSGVNHWSRSCRLRRAGRACTTRWCGSWGPGCPSAPPLHPDTGSCRIQNSSL